MCGFRWPRARRARQVPVCVVAPAGGTRADAICEALVRAGRTQLRTTPGEFTAPAAGIAHLLQARDIEVWWVDDDAAGVASPPTDPCAPLLGLVRDWPQLVRRLSGTHASVTLVTRGAFAARGSDPPAPRDSEAALAAFVAGLMVEHEDLRPGSWTWIRRRPMRPARAGRSANSSQASARRNRGAPLRGDTALALRLERYRPLAAAAAAAADTQRRHIITGGLGGCSACGSRPDC